MIRRFLVALTFTVVAVCAYAQSPKEIGMRVWALTSEQPAPSIQLQWPAEANQQFVYIWRKTKEAPTFPANPTDSVVGNATSWTDRSIALAVGYEYRLMQFISKGSGTSLAQFYATGYIHTGIKVPPVAVSRVLILVDSTMWEPLTVELETMARDLEAEGFIVTKREAPRAEAFDPAKVERVRTIIKDEARSGGPTLSAVVLIGRVPVPYAGNIAPDAHIPDHQGAWPADGMYGDIDGTYTDNITTVNNTSRPVNANAPKDGKYDQSQFATDVDVAIGRIDFFDMPAFKESETELLKRYLSKNHAYRSGQWNVRVGAIIDDNFSSYSDAFAASAWRSFGGFAGDTALRAGDFFTDLSGATTWLFAYGCGGGTDNSAGGIGTTADFTTKPVNAVFTFLFGSYFGDWNTRNNFLRAALAAQPGVLTTAWSGRPHWYMHHMALGETIGYSTRISQNNRPLIGNQLGNYIPTLYVQANGNAIASYGDRQVHVALLGDPTLRAWISPIPTVQRLVSRIEPANVKSLTWMAPSDPVDGYDVYRKVGSGGRWKQLTSKPITATTFADTLKYDGEVEYMVRCCKLRSSASGSWYDAGRGVITSLTTVGVHDERGVASADVEVAPNPTSEWCRVTVSTPMTTSLSVELLDITGSIVQSMAESDVASGSHVVSFPVQHLASGHYIVRVTTHGGTVSQLLQVVR